MYTPDIKHIAHTPAPSLTQGGRSGGNVPLVRPVQRFLAKTTVFLPPSINRYLIHRVPLFTLQQIPFLALECAQDGQGGHIVPFARLAQ